VIADGSRSWISLERAYRASAAIWAGALLVSLRSGSLAVCLGLTLGCAITLGVFASWELMVRKALAPRAAHRGAALAVGFLKLPIVAGLVYALVSREVVHPVALAAGLPIPLIAVTLLATAHTRKEPAELASPRRG
jgi:hypothetical protein